MTTAELQWLVGTAIGVVLSIAGIAIGAFRSMSGRLDKAVEKIEGSMKHEDDRLHERVNRVRDEYVRRDDFDKSMERVDGTLRDIREDQKKMIDMLTARAPSRR